MLKQARLREEHPLRYLLWLEPVLLLALVGFFWFPSWYPGPHPAGEIDRFDYAGLLALLLPLMGLRYVLHGRLWTRTPLDVWLVAFVVLGLLNTVTAPYELRGPVLLLRPLLGIALLLYLTELARSTGTMRWPLFILIAAGLIVGVLALTGTQYISKSDSLRPLIDLVPEYRPFFLGAGFNPNEVAGAVSWLAPLTFGLVFYRWKQGRVVLRVMTGAAFVLLLLALMFGQSRFAIGGVLGALGLMTLLVVPVPWRYAALAGVAALVLLQAAILFNWLPQPTTADDQGGGVSSRDERTFTQRFAIWDAALGIISDYPLTGGGMASFRYGAVRDVYPVIGMDVAPPGEEATFNPRPRPPHAHNEFVHIATDLGIPGLIVFTAWYVVTAYMLWVCWQSGDYNARVVAVAVGGGLLAHIGYGMGDAIPLWDRFSFLLFMLFGLAAGQYVLVRQNNVAMDEQATQSNQYLTS